MRQATADLLSETRFTSSHEPDLRTPLSSELSASPASSPALKKASCSLWVTKVHFFLLVESNSEAYIGGETTFTFLAAELVFPSGKLWYITKRPNDSRRQMAFPA